MVNKNILYNRFEEMGLLKLGKLISSVKPNLLALKGNLVKMVSWFC